MPEIYRHTQIAWFIIIPIDIATIAALYFAVTASSVPAMLLVIFLLILTYLFFGLTVIGTEDTLEIRFGTGLIRKEFKIRDIVSAEPYRTSFWQGWGIKYSSDGLIFNVAGYEAVRLTMTNGKRYIIGTDEPGKLLHFIEAHRH